MNVDTSPRALGQLVLVTTVLITIMEPDVSQKHGMWSCGDQYIVLHMTDYESTMLGDLSDYLWIVLTIHLPAVIHRVQWASTMQEMSRN